MRLLCLTFVLLVQFLANAQKGWELQYNNENYKSFIKHPQTEFKDSLSLVRYLKDLQFEAIKKGYLLASIDSLFLSNKRGEVSIHIGDKFDNAVVDVDAAELKFLRRHSRLNERFIASLDIRPKQLAENMKSISEVYFNNGYPFASIQLVPMEFTGTNIIANLEIDRGPIVTWSEIHIKGDSSFSVNYISTLIGVKKDGNFDQSSLDQISTRIDQVPFISEMKQHEILFTDKGAELYLYLQSNPISSVNGIVGFQPDPISKTIAFTGDLNLKLLNVLKRGELLTIRWQSIRDQTQSLNSRLNYPFLFKTPFGINATFDLYKRDSSFLELNSTFGVQYMLSRGSSLTAFYNLVSSSVLSGAKNNPTFISLGTTRTNSYGLTLRRNQVDYLPNPSKGYNIRLTGSVGTRSAQISDTSAVEKSAIYRGRFVGETFVPLFRRHVLRFAGDFKFYNAPVIYENEVFRFGGLGSQRGFNEDELSSTTMVVMTAEYRFLLDRNSHLFLFYDQSLYENASGSYYQDYPLGFGTGFSFSTNFGVFSISYALGKQFDNPVLLSNGKIHFGYIAYF